MLNSEEKLEIAQDVMRMASEVGPRASIQSIRLVHVSAMLEIATPDVVKHVRNRRRSEFSRRGESSLDVDIRFGLDLATNEQDKNEPPISIEARYRLAYNVEGLSQFDDEQLRAFSRVNGYFNAWPFWRELTTSMLARTQAGSFLLPTLRVQVTEEQPSPPNPT